MLVPNAYQKIKSGLKLLFSNLLQWPTEIVINKDFLASVARTTEGGGLSYSVMGNWGEQKSKDLSPNIIWDNRRSTGSEL